MNGRVREWISRTRQSLRPSRTDGDIAEELQSHLESAEEALRRQGVSPQEAARIARVQFGGPTQAIEEVRAARGIPGIDAFWLDVKLGFRMLRKHWGLTLVGGLAMAFSMTLAASLFTYAQSRAGTSLPFPDGARVVIVQRWSVAARTSQTSSLEDFDRWRTLRSVVDLGAFRISDRNVTTPAGLAGPEPIVAMTANAFKLAGVAPRLGRYLLPEDERPGASPVIVIGSDVWQTYFASDPSVVGKTLQLDGEAFTVVGVMPRNFGFPIRNEYWTPLNRNDRSGLTVFGRLSPGTSIVSAQAEAATLGLPNTPDSAEQVRIVPYVTGITGGGVPWLAWIVPLLGALLLLPPCLNIGALIYARTVSRQGEFAARAALGASRRRIVTQIFIETLLLTSGSAALAMFFSPKVAAILSAMLPAGQQPFWINFEVSYLTFLLSGGLAVFAALVAGALPALRATGRWKLDGLHLLNRSTAPRLGRLWTATVVVQVALSVAFVPLVAELTWSAIRPQVAGPGFDASRYLTAQLSLTQGTPASRFVDLRNELARRLRAEPGVSAVSLSASVPFEERSVMVELSAQPIGAERKEASINRVEPAFFDSLGARFLVGTRDIPPGGAIVNQAFIKRVLEDANPLGRQIRLFGMNGGSPPLGQYEIAGVVADLSPASTFPAVYLPLTDTPDAAADAPHQIRIMLRGDPTIPANAAARIRETAAALDPRLRVDDLQTLDEVYRGSSMAEYVMGIALAALALSVVLFSITGIYTLMSFSVEHRRREIGICSALGASATRLALGAFRRVLMPVAVGVVVGALAAIAVDSYFAPVLFEGDAEKRLRWLAPAGELFVFVIAVVVLICPVRRALRVDPAEALREG